MHYLHLLVWIEKNFQMVRSWAATSASSTDHPVSRRGRSLWLTSLHVVLRWPRLCYEEELERADFHLQTTLYVKITRWITSEQSHSYSYYIIWVLLFSIKMGSYFLCTTLCDTYLISGSLWSLMTFMVTSQALRKMPSHPMGPMASTMLCVMRNGTLSGQSKVSPWNRGITLQVSNRRRQIPFHATREEIYGDLPKVSEVVRGHSLNFAAHCARRLNKTVSQVFWCLQQGACSQWRPRLTYPKLLTHDTGIHQQDVLNLSKDRVQWWKFIKNSDCGQQN